MRILINATSDELTALYKDVSNFIRRRVCTITFYYETSPDHFSEIIPDTVTETKVQAADGECISIDSCRGLCVYDHYTGRFKNSANLEYTLELEEFYRLKNGTTIYGVFNQIREYLGYQAVDYSKMTYRDTVKPPTEVRESSFLTIKFFKLQSILKVC